MVGASCAVWQLASVVPEQDSQGDLPVSSTAGLGDPISLDPGADLDGVIGRLPIEQRQAVVQIIRASESSHSGPLPPPRQLREYEQALPGLAERIVRLAEAEQDHRHGIINLVQSGKRV